MTEGASSAPDDMTEEEFDTSWERADPTSLVGCDLCRYFHHDKKCLSAGAWRKPGLPPVEQVLRFWLAHGLNPGIGGGYHGHHAQALVELVLATVPRHPFAGPGNLACAEGDHYVENGRCTACDEEVEGCG